jgi:hypothetical protein
MVSGKLPPGVALVVEMLRVDVAPAAVAVTVPGVKLPVAFAGRPSTESATPALNPLTPVTVTV